MPSAAANESRRFMKSPRNEEGSDNAPSTQPAEIPFSG
jgi:hypothetical protein